MGRIAHLLDDAENSKQQQDERDFDVMQATDQRSSVYKKGTHAFRGDAPCIACISAFCRRLSS
jgi:hypothetical protein